jgi:hypothetical protein
MPILKKFPKEPVDVQDYDIDFNTWLASFNPVDTITVKPTTSCDTGITIASSSYNAGVLKVWITGGTNGGSYKVTATAVTTGGRTKQIEIVIRVADT